MTVTTDTQSGEFVDPSQRPLIYASTGSLSMGPGIEVSKSGELYVEGSNIRNTNCGSF